MRKYIGGNDDRLEKWADEIASRTCMRDYRDGNSHDWNRTSTKAERAVLRAVAFGALLSLNWGDAIRNDESPTGRSAAQAVLDTAEFTATQLMKQFMPDGVEYQAYDGIYCPLSRILREWPTM